MAEEAIQGFVAWTLSLVQFTEMVGGVVRHDQHLNAEVHGESQELPLLGAQLARPKMAPPAHPLLPPVSTVDIARQHLGGREGGMSSRTM